MRTTVTRSGGGSGGGGGRYYGTRNEGMGVEVKEWSGGDAKCEGKGKKERRKGRGRMVMSRAVARADEAKAEDGGRRMEDGG